MSLTSRLAGGLLFTTALVSPTMAFAQADPAPSSGAESLSAQSVPAEAAREEEQADISVPGGGGDIIVTGSRNRNAVRASNQVVSVLTTEEIARTGEGNIAGALGRVTGLSVVGSGYVYVRGLGDRYSLALLNGSPLPSPEPLRRVVPLDIFPSGVIASSLVQKSYSANFPGEFGGGVINLTTKAVPKESFLTVGGGFQVDSEATGEFGYSYYGAKSDWTGFDNGSRDVPPALQAFYDSGASLNSGTVNTRVIGSELVRFSRATLQKVGDLPVNFSASITGGTSWDLGGADFGIIGAAGFSNKWTNRQASQQTSFNGDLSTLQTDFDRVTTENRIVANGLIGLGLEFGENKIRWTNLYIRDTIKQGRLAVGERAQNGFTYIQQNTGWYERQLIDTQFVGEFKPAPKLSVEVRGGFANSQREAPYETFFEYARTNNANDPYGAMFVNRLNGNVGDASVTFSDLNEDLWSAGLDVSYKLSSSITATVGGAFSDTDRVSTRRQFLFRASSTFPTEASVLRPDLLLSPGLVTGTASGGTTVGGVDLIEPDEATPSFRGTLRNWAGYAKANMQFTDALSLDAGVRFEKARQEVTALQVFATAPNYTPTPALRKEYWLPGATLTWQIQPELQARISASKTIARPQFRELIYQPFFDPESNRQYLGNPLLTDSKLYNGEARLEYYFAPEQRVSIAGFYKKLDKPIESFITVLSDALVTSYANAPEAQLYGAEFEATKFFDLSNAGGWLTNRRALLIANYTYTKSKLKVAANDTVAVYAASSGIATDYFLNGSPLTGQSDHLVNLQIGLENTERLSQQTLLVSFASERVVSRGLNGSVRQPDVIEKPGIQLDFVVREGAEFLGQDVELKFEARNLLGTRHREYQRSGDNTVEFNTYDVGRVIAFSAQFNF